MSFPNFEIKYCGHKVDMVEVFNPTWTPQTMKLEVDSDGTLSCSCSSDKCVIRVHYETENMGVLVQDLPHSVTMKARKARR